MQSPAPRRRRACAAPPARRCSRLGFPVRRGRWQPPFRRRRIQSIKCSCQSVLSEDARILLRMKIVVGASAHLQKAERGIKPDGRGSFESRTSRVSDITPFSSKLPAERQNKQPRNPLPPHRLARRQDSSYPPHPERSGFRHSRERYRRLLQPARDSARFEAHLTGSAQTRGLKSMPLPAPLPAVHRPASWVQFLYPSLRLIPACAALCLGQQRHARALPPAASVRSEAAVTCTRFFDGALDDQLVVDLQNKPGLQLPLAQGRGRRAALPA